MPWTPRGVRAGAACRIGLVTLVAAGCAPALAPLPTAGAPVPARRPASASAPASKTGASSPSPTPSKPTPKATVPSTGRQASVPAVDGDPASPDALASAAAGVFGEGGAEPSWDIDVRSYETHERVGFYTALYSGTSRGAFTRQLSRGTRYEPMIRAKLRAAGMPEDLTYLALIESGYDPHAYSRAAAVGMWQFMSSTARGVGLRVDWWMDERRDPARATDAAITFLGYLTREFGSLYLAAAAYNGGPGRVSRGLTRFASQMEGAEGDDRFFALAEQDYLRSETKDYVPKLIAAALLAKTPDRYGFAVESLPPYVYDSVQVEGGTSLAVVAEAAGVTPVELRDLNPALLRGITPPDATGWVKVPMGTGVQAEMGIAAFPEELRRGYRTVTVKGSSTTPAVLAKREAITLAQLRKFNPGLKTSSKGRLSAGQMVRIPTVAVLGLMRDVPDPGIERYGSASSASSTGTVHVVRRGETLGGIARRYQTTVPRLQALNGLKGTRVAAGQRLTVRGSSTAARTASATKTSAKTTSTKKAPAKTTSTKKAPVKTTSTKKAPAKTTSTKKAPAKTPPAKKPVAKTAS